MAVQELEPLGVVPEAEAVREALQRVLESRQFRTSRRSKQFLQYVVDQKVAGHEHLLKERIIGADVFGRSANYATGEDAVVRVQATDVRRRLELYYAALTDHEPLVIVLPLGSYIPIFKRIEEKAALPLKVEDDRNTALTEEIASAPAPVMPSLRLHTRARITLRMLLTGTGLLIALLAVILAAVLLRRGNESHGRGDALSQFWAPLDHSNKSVLLCLAKPVMYRPTAELFARFNKEYASGLHDKIDQEITPIPFRADEKLQWRDLRASTNSGPAIGGVTAAIRFGTLFGRRNTQFNVRFGDEPSLADLREANAVVVGALNSRTLADIDSGLHFTFIDQDGELRIRENVLNGRIWSMERNAQGRYSRDYGLITRQMSSRTGMFVIEVAGISDSGTQAASEVITSPDRLAEFAKQLPKGWQNKNLQVLIATDLTFGRPSAPQFVSSYSW
ncbi:hypothetical protein [Terriglobus sp.]|uniref:hypothetical protein n=1 Tax=Terriglobus sp. TaxID=1889013 RepID=UPI003B00597B